MFNRRVFLVFVLLLASLSILGSFSAAQEPVTITVLVEGGGLMLQEEAAKLFEEQTGYIVEFVEVPYASVVERLSAEMAAQGSSFDVATIDVVWMSRFADFAEPLDALFTEEVIADLFPALVADAQIGGTYVGMPTWANAEIIYYRKDLWEDPAEMEAFEAEYGYPLAAPTTWQEFTDMAQFFTRDTDGDGEIDLYGTDVKGNDFEWMLAVLQAGSEGLILDADHKIIIDNEAHLEGLEWYISHHCDLGVTPPNPLEIGWGEAETLFLEGKTAMFRFWGHAYRLADQMREGNMPVGVAPMIAGPGGVGSIPGPWFNIVPKTSENKEAALEFVQFMYDHNALGVEAPLGLAARISAFEQYADQEGFENLNPLIETLNAPQTMGRPIVNDWQQIADEVLLEIAQGALSCDEDPAELLAWGREQLEAMGYK